MNGHEINESIVQLHRNKKQEIELAYEVFEKRGFDGLLDLMMAQAKEMVYMCESLKKAKESLQDNL